MKIRRFSELVLLDTFEQRFDYLRLTGAVGRSTFGFDRWLNQKFYRSREWRRARRDVILRDNGCDLGIYGRDIHHDLLVHHMNPMAVEDIVHGEEWIIDPEFLITTAKSTHNAIHYGGFSLVPKVVEARSPNDTTLWQPRKVHNA